MSETLGRAPGLAVVIVGDDPASHVYVRSKARACAEAGMHSEVLALADTTSESAVLETVDALNDDPRIDGILCQLPLPAHIDPDRVDRKSVV